MVSPGDIQEAEQFGYPSVETQLADTNEKRQQCEGCLGYYEVDKLDSQIWCDECRDKAASYDITASERKALGKVIQETIPILDKLIAPSYPVGEVIGRLRTVLNNCRFKEGE